jgi:4-carboxymuconolactone decarboxylase
MTSLDPPTRALIQLAAAIALGRTGLIADRCRAATAAGVSPLWVDELILQSVLMAGYPRALTAAAVWREVVGAPADPLEDGTDFTEHPAWRVRGEATCRTIYGANYEKLRANVRRLHPALDQWMITEGYGRTLSRPGLDLSRRELCVVAQVAVLGADRQLHSHLKGSLNVGIGPSLIEEALGLALADADPADRRVAEELWHTVRP